MGTYNFFIQPPFRSPLWLKIFLEFLDRNYFETFLAKKKKEKRKKEIRLEFRDRNIENLRWPSLYKSRLISSNGEKKKKIRSLDLNYEF